MAIGNVEQARRLSTKMFGQKHIVIEETEKGRTASMVGDRNPSRRVSVAKPETKNDNEESSELGRDVLQLTK